MRRVALAIIAAASLAIASCVPASEAAPPRGAFGFVTEPSPASLGEPFLTRDGWTIRIEKLVLQVSVGAQSKDHSQRYSYGSYEQYRFDGRLVAELFARKVPVGPATASMTLQGSYLYDSSRNSDEERTEVLGVPPEVSARFQVPAEADLNAGKYPSYSGPSLLLAVRAEKAGRIITFDLTLSVSAAYTEGQGQGVVQEDALVTTPMRIAGEAMFLDAQTHALQFDDFAAADTNQDGVLTGAELGGGALSEIYARGSGLFVLR